MPLPVETTVWKPMPRCEPSALTATLPLCEISATGPAGSACTESPQIAAPAARLTMPLPFGPQTGMPPARAASASADSRSRPLSTSPKPADTTTAPPQPRSAAAAIAPGTAAAGIATATASTGSGRSAIVGTHSISPTARLPGLTPQTGPANPNRSRLARIVLP